MPPVLGVPLLRLRLGAITSQPGGLLRSPATLLLLLRLLSCRRWRPR